MRFRTRAFLLCFLPVALLLAGTFGAIQQMVQQTVMNGLRVSLRENHRAITGLRSQSDLQNSRFLKVAGENASLKAGVQLLLTYPGNDAAKRTVEDQLRELCGQMGFDFLVVSDTAGIPLAGVIEEGGGFAPVTTFTARLPRQGLMAQNGTVYEVASVPIDGGDENIGKLSVGERFSFSRFNNPAVLMRHGKVLQSSIPGSKLQDVEAALKGCGQAECDIQLGGVSYIALVFDSSAFGGTNTEYTVWTLQNVDAASAPVQIVLNRVFLFASVGLVLAALLGSAISAQSIVKPIAGMISHLRKSERTGELPEFSKDLSSIREIRDLTSSFNRAGGAAREARHSLRRAYVEFVESLANALDARDPYTAGHSGRVSELSCATGMALGVRPGELEELRVGALLHDIGKIGICDAVLQKKGKLSADEFALIKQHPEIGRRILQGVHGFAPYLAAVELHHENWDGTGYPRGQAGETTPLAARIIHVSDAYDAMTTNRPYRQGMSHEDAIAILREYAGRHFDPAVVEVFCNLAVHRASAAEAKAPFEQTFVSTA
jgi:HD-GYP domain-containing protein (c-di-GMP phosphodiesterase class II)